MALDKTGVPIPVYTPPPPPPPDENPPDHINPQIENDIALLKGEVARLNARIESMGSLNAEVGSLRSRVDGLETSNTFTAQTLSRFAVVEQMSEGMPKLLERIAELEGLNAKNEETISMTRTQLDSLEKRVLEMWERGLVNPI